MNNIRNYFSRQGIRPILIILQMVIGFTVFSISLSLISGSEQYVKKVNSIASNDILRLYIEDTQDKSPQKLQFFYNNLASLTETKNIGSYLVQNIPFQELRGFSLIEKESKRMYGEVPTIFVDEYFLKWHSFNVKEGRTLKSTDSNMTQRIPILVGVGLGSEFPVGTIITSGIADDRKMTVIEKEFEVVGVLNEALDFWKGGSSSIEDTIFSSNISIIAPIQEEQQYGNQLWTRLSTNVLIEPVENLDREKKLVEEKALALGLKTRLQSVEFQLAEYKNKSKPVILFTLTFSLILLLLSTFGLAGVVLISTLERYHEFGIRFAVGATIRNLILLVLYDVAFLLFISSGIGITLTYLISIGSNFPLPLAFSLVNLLLSLCLIIIITIISTLLPVIKLVNIPPIQLIRGDHL